MSTILTSHTPPQGRSWRVVLGTLVAPLVAMAALNTFFQLNIGAGLTLYNLPSLFVVTYLLMGLQGLALAITLEYGFQPRCRDSLRVILSAVLFGAVCGVASPLAWFDLRFTASAALAGATAGLVVAVLTRSMWVRAARQAPMRHMPASPQPLHNRAVIGIVLGLLTLSCMILSLLTLWWVLV